MFACNLFVKNNKFPFAIFFSFIVRDPNISPLEYFKEEKLFKLLKPCIEYEKLLLKLLML